jgi:hypothetical protein
VKATLFSLFVVLLMGGCVNDRWVDRTLLKPLEAVTSVRERKTDYYDNGQRKYERTWKGRDLDGPVTWWYENGQKRQQINYKDGNQHGLFIVWDENGKEIRRENFKDGEKVED